MRFTRSILYITFTKYTKVPRLELSHEYKRLEILAKFTKSKDFKKKQNINLFWSRSSDAALIVNFPHRFWLTRTVHECFSSFADYIHEWTNLNSVFNAESLDIAKKIRKPLCKEESPALLLSRSSHHGRLKRIPRYSSFFQIFALVVSSFLRICWTMKALASIDSFFGLPEQNWSKFARELVRRRHLILLV